MLRDENNKISSTRICLYVMLILFCLIVGAGLAVDVKILDTIEKVLLLCIGGNTVKTAIKNGKA